MTDEGDGLEEIVRRRRSIRSFKDESVPLELIEELLETAMWAPSPHNSQPWRFTVLSKRRDRERLAAAMAARLEAELREDGLAAEVITKQTSRSRERISSAPVAILCSLTGEGLASFPDERRMRLEWQMAVQSLGAVLQTFFLLAHQKGLGTCWMAAPMYCQDVVREALELPSEFEPQALVLAGYPATSGKQRERRAPATVVEMR